MKNIAKVREKLVFDIAIVGAGVAGLSAGIKLKQLDPNLEICILEKSSSIGGHVLSGCQFNPRALYELLPNWHQLSSPLTTKVSKSQYLYLTTSSQFKIPNTLTPWNNYPNDYLVSLSELCRWLKSIADSLNIRVIESFTAKDLIFSSLGAVEGVVTGEVGLNPDHSFSETYQPGLDILAKQTIIAEGAKGKLSQQVIDSFKLIGYHDLQYHSEPQTYSLGFKEVWKNPDTTPGLAFHTFGWPLSNSRSRGFLYTEGENVHIGLIPGLDYTNPNTNLYEEFQKFKTHNFFKDYLKGECIEFGAKVLDDGGFFSVPKLSAPGVLLVGSAGGMSNPLTGQGAHLAMKSGIVAAETIHSTWGTEQKDTKAYYKAYVNSWAFEELYKVRNMRQAFNNSALFGLFYSWFNWETSSVRSSVYIENNIKGDNYAASECTRSALESEKIEYLAKDGVVAVDKGISLERTGVLYREQPQFVKVKAGNEKNVALSFLKYGGIEERVCPTGVFRYSGVRMEVESSKCILCGACGIKSFREMIKVELPESGTGPN